MKTRTLGTGPSGFTLIEVMVVIAIIAGVLAFGAPALFNTSSQKRTAVRKLAVLTREVRNIGRLTGTTQRLVIQMDPEGGHGYWIESASGSVTMLSEEQREELERLTEAQREDEAPKNEFSPDTRVLRKPVTLPRGFYFDSVEYVGNEKAVSEGKAYVHFFPQGISEAAAIHLTDRKTLSWTITVHPLTGRAEVYEGKLSLKELQTK